MWWVLGVWRRLGAPGDVWRRLSSLVSTMAEPQEEPSRSRYSTAGISGPHPCDADSLDLALFAVGWEHLKRDLRAGLSSAENVAAVESVLETHSVHAAFVARNNVVNYKKVLLGVYRNGVTLSPRPPQAGRLLPRATSHIR